MSTPAQYIGSVTAESEESWNPGTGTVYMTGQFVALIRASSSVQGYIYTSCCNGAPVKEMWSRRPQSGDQYCTGGAVSGQVCGWTVDWVAGNYYYTDSGETARNVTHGTKRQQCQLHGDSGGPVYTVRSDGGISAKGIISGEWIHDSYVDWYELYSCENVFTDIWDAYWGLPGWLVTS